MKQFTYTIKDEVGMHARPAGSLVKKAQGFESETVLEVKGRTANAKGILGVMGLAAAKGDVVSVSVEGPDEDEAAKAIQDFFEQSL